MSPTEIKEGTYWENIEEIVKNYSPKYLYKEEDGVIEYIIITKTKRKLNIIMISQEQDFIEGNLQILVSTGNKRLSKQIISDLESRFPITFKPIPQYDTEIFKKIDQRYPD